MHFLISERILLAAALEEHDGSGEQGTAEAGGNYVLGQAVEEVFHLVEDFCYQRAGAPPGYQAVADGVADEYEGQADEDELEAVELAVFAQGLACNGEREH